ncbi:hypothetical protein SanaruYs_28690 [Chryseotalea sanaruensis]|uniref:DUF1735 domain-containing protein n=2 Tax=Chryseotalea sanaruensis TaxID=2482724 RepID=A0A401UCN4_9BACT|nr:hypothetical protein SanaruYs_28690 [Chryseotalea sanaruensis]
MTKVRKSAVILVLWALFGACLDQPDCYNLTNNTVNISYRKIFDGALDTVAIESVTIVGFDSVFKSTNRAVTIPLDFTKTGVSVVLDAVEGTRLIDLGYKVQPQFVSEECGPRFLFSELTASSPSGDSVRILSGTPGGEASHVAIYRCPRNNFVRLAFKQVVDEDNVKDTVSIASTAANFEALTYYPISGELSYMNLPLNLNTTSTQITLELSNPSRVATLTFNYDLVQKTVFQVCGEQTFIANVQVSSDVFEFKKIETTRYVADSIYDPPKINFAAFQ